MKQFYEAVGGSYEAAAKTSHDEAKMAERLLEFSRDMTYPRIRDYAARQEFKAMRIEISALCSVSKYLGLSGIAGCCEKIAEGYAYKADFCVSDLFKERMAELDTEYRKVQEGILLLSPEKN
ncbi:MAG: hypothetical protein Q4E57_09405 [Eubacteriales bacterium]|nr:hypothetical protein [Eubacteriales bacterium]